MKKTSGRPPKIPVIPPGVAKDLADNFRALMQEWRGRRPSGESETDAFREFAKKKGVGYGTLQRVKKASSSTRLDSIEKLAEAFNISVPELLTKGEGERLFAQRRKRVSSDDDDSRVLQRDGS